MPVHQHRMVAPSVYVMQSHLVYGSGPWRGVRVHLG